MPPTPRELVHRCLRLEEPERIPRDLWVLPWAEERFPEEVEELRARFPGDLVAAPRMYAPSLRVRGERYSVGAYVDEWGCTFENAHGGVIGEVKAPLITDVRDCSACRPPWEILPEDERAARDRVDRFCEQTDRFVLADCCPRPWERMQFLRGSAEAMMDLVEPEKGARELIGRIHEFHLRELELWASTRVDALWFMDDWGSQNAMLVDPRTWRELFKPLYRDYCELAHAAGKFAFMHSDGCITDILEDLVEVGVDAINAQLFTMDIAELGERFRGRIAFWGEIDRQQVLRSEDPAVVREAVREVARHLHDPRGGIIAQLELGPGVLPRNVSIAFEEWERVQAEAR